MAQLRRHNACVGEASFDLVYERSYPGARARSEKSVGIIPGRSLHRLAANARGITRGKRETVRVAQFSSCGDSTTTGERPAGYSGTRYVSFWGVEHRVLPP